MRLNLEGVETRPWRVPPGQKLPPPIHQCQQSGRPVSWSADRNRHHRTGPCYAPPRTDVTDATARYNAGPLIAIIASLPMIGPFAIDTFFPAFPAIGREFGASPFQFQQALSLYLVAYAVMSLWHNGLSDALGRKPQRVHVGLGGLRAGHFDGHADGIPRAAGPAVAAATARRRPPRPGRGGNDTFRPGADLAGPAGDCGACGLRHGGEARSRAA